MFNLKCPFGLSVWVEKLIFYIHKLKIKNFAFKKTNEKPGFLKIFSSPVLFFRYEK